MQFGKHSAPVNGNSIWRRVLLYTNFAVLIFCILYGQYFPIYRLWYLQEKKRPGLLYLSVPYLIDTPSRGMPIQVKIIPHLQHYALACEARRVLFLGAFRTTQEDVLEISLKSNIPVNISINGKLIEPKRDGGKFYQRLSPGSHSFFLSCGNNKEINNLVQVSLQRHMQMHWHILSDIEKHLQDPLLRRQIAHFPLPPCLPWWLFIEIYLIIASLFFLYRFLVFKIPGQVITIILCSFLLRSIFVMGWHRPIDYVYSDMAGYWERSFEFYNSFEDHPYRSFYPPGTHWFYGLFFLTFGVERYYLLELLFVVLSTAISYLVIAITAALLNLRCALWAGWLTVIHYPFISLSGFFMAEIPVTFLVLLGLWLWIRFYQTQKIWFSILSITVLANAAYVKTISLPFMLEIIAYLALCKRKMLALLLLLIAIAILTPSLIRTHRLTGEYHLISSNGGINFFGGNSYFLTVHLFSEHGEYWFQGPLHGYTRRDQPTFHANLAPWNSQELTDFAWLLIRDDPLRALKNCCSTTFDLFSIHPPWPESHTKFYRANALYHYFFSFVLLPAAVAGAILLLIRCTLEKRLVLAVVMLLLPICNALVVAFVFDGSARYRIPNDPYLLILSAVALWALWEKFAAARS